MMGDPGCPRGHVWVTYTGAKVSVCKNCGAHLPVMERMMQTAVPREAIMEGPHVTWDHIDGPLMTWAGELHWLTWRERVLIALRLSSVDRVADRVWPHLARHRMKLQQMLIG